jgi:hypothetical protein
MYGEVRRENAALSDITVKSSFFVLSGFRGGFYAYFLFNFFRLCFRDCSTPLAHVEPLFFFGSAYNVKFTSKARYTFRSVATSRRRPPLIRTVQLDLRKTVVGQIDYLRPCSYNFLLLNTIELFSYTSSDSGLTRRLTFFPSPVHGLLDVSRINSDFLRAL